MSNRVCSSCGKTYESFGLSSGPAICNECFSEKNPDIPEQEDTSNFDFDNNVNVFNLNSNEPEESNNDSKLKSSHTTTTFIADTFIGLMTVFFFINVLVVLFAAAVLGTFFGVGVAIIILILGFIITIVSFGIASIFAEIYRSLRGVEETLNRMNAKIKK